MPRSCPICDHEDLDEINAALASNERIRTIAERWSVRKTALMRHRNEHLPYSAIEAKEAEAKEAEAKEAETKEAEEDVPFVFLRYRVRRLLHSFPTRRGLPRQHQSSRRRGRRTRAAPCRRHA